MNESWSQLANTQAGMVSQRQLTELHVSRSFVHNQPRARRWVQRTSSVFSTTTGPLSWQQRLWQAVLHAGPTATIGGLTAAELHGMKNWSREDITVLVDDELSFDPLEGVYFFCCRRLRAEPTDRARCGHGHRPATPHHAGSVEPLAWADDSTAAGAGAPGVAARHRRWSSLAVGDRPASRLRKVRRRGPQKGRRDRRGRRRWTDAEWDLPDGSVLVLEV
jgi:hypothetical protein